MQFGFNTQGSGGDEAVTWKLTGDCEFDAVTVSSGDTLECGTHDITTSGTLTVEGTFTGGSGLHNINSINANNSTGSLTLTSGITFLNGGGSSCFGLASGLSDLSFAQGTLVFNQSDGNQRFEFNRAPNSNSKRMGRVVFNNGPNNAAFLNAVAWTSSTRVPTGDIIVASTDTTNGFLTNNFDLSTDGNMTIATGGKLSAGSSTLTVAGDFTTSGGLLGASCLDLEKDNKEYVRIPVDGSTNTHLQSPHTSGAMTVEAWVKIESDAEMAVWHKGTDYVFSVNPSGGATKLAWADGSHYNFSSWELTLESGQLNVGKWHHLACVRDVVGSNGRASYYIDGKLVGRVTNTSSNATWTDADTFDLYVGRYQDSDSGAGQNYFDGNIENLRIWNVARTDAQIRESMFTAEYADGTSGLVEQWLFNEGNSYVVAGTNPTSAASYANGAGEQYTSSEQANYTNIWAGAGTFTKGTSTIDMTGNGTVGIAGGVTSFHNLKVAASGKTTTLSVLAGSSDIRFHGTLTHGGGTANSSGNPAWTMKGTSTVSAGSDWTGWYLCYWESSTAVPTASWKYWLALTDSTLAGDMTCTGYFRPHQSVVDIGNHTVTTHEAIFASTGGVNMGAGSLIFANAAGLSTTVSDSVFTAGPGATIDGVAAKSTFKSQNSFQIVGDISDLNVTNEELTVVGTVTNCTGDILQFTPGHDTTLSLETDTAEDRDIRLGGPSLDNANHLIAE